MKKFRLSLTIALLTTVLLGFTAKADAPNNPYSITNESVFVAEDLFESGDMCFFLECNIDYDSGNITAPSEDPWDAYIMIVKSNDEATTYGARGARRLQLSLHSVYFTAAEVTSLGLTSGSSYKIIMSANPSLFPVITEDVNKDTTTLSSTNWYSGDDMLDELEDYILDVVDRMEVTNSETLSTTTPEGYTILNTTGSYIISDARPGISSELPGIFIYSSSGSSFPSVTGNASYAQYSTLTNRLGTKLTAAFTGIGDFFGFSAQTSAGIWILLFALTVASMGFIASGNTGVGVIIAVPVLFLGQYLGAIPTAIVFTAAFFLIAYVAYFIWIRGA